MTSLLVTLVISLSSLIFGGDEVEIVFAGDAMQHEAQNKAAKQADGSYSFDECFAAIAPYVEEADYAVVNLETPLGGAPYSGYPMFCAPDSYSEALKKAGFDLMLTANNHALDKRDKGAKRTLDVLDEQGLDHVGTYRNKADREKALPLIKDINGFKIAFLNYTYGTNGIKVQNDVVVDYIDKTKIKKDIATARANGAEVLCVCMHWGVEYVLLPNAQQKALADFLTEEGVDLIIGGHPHVIQPMEMRWSKTHNKKVFLIYSLGNLISNMTTKDTRGGALAKVKLVRDENGNPVVDSASYRLVFTLQPGGGSKNFRLIPVENYKSGALKSNCNVFVNNAEKIFNKHNIDVPRDTTPIRAK